MCEVEFLGGVVFKEGANSFLKWATKTTSLLPDS